MDKGKRILIVGGGLAGSFLAAESILAGHEVDLYDHFDPQAPTQVAAGLYNVITGRLASKTWMAEAFLQSLHQFFEHPYFQSLAPFLQPMDIYRPYKSMGERNEWCLKAIQPEYRQLVRHQYRPILTDQVHNELGGLVILPCGWVDTAALVREMKQVLAEKGKFTWHPHHFDYPSLDPQKLRLANGEAYDEVIFAEGPAIRHNPWFSWLPIAPLKGQVMEIEIEDFPEDLVVLRKVFIVPRGEGRYVVGSTYEKKFDHLNPTSEGIATLIEYISKAIRSPFRQIEVRAGARLTTPNRRPICGRHPEYPGLMVFNGLGTKGVLQAPWTARHFRQCLDDQTPSLLKDISIDRFRG